MFSALIEPLKKDLHGTKCGGSRYSFDLRRSSLLMDITFKSKNLK